MADRFPLAVNETSRKIEELISGDNLNLTGNGISIAGSTGISGQYLKSIGNGIIWDNPGDVYLSASQTVLNKTFESCTISGSTNFFSNIANSSLVNSSITINGTSILLGGNVTTPDNNTTYTVSAVDGANAQEKIIRLTSGGNSGSGINDDVTLIAGSNVSLSRLNDEITINSSFTDTNTVTRVASGTGGSFVSGDITIAAGAFTSVSQVGGTITIVGQDTDTVTQLRAGTGGSFSDGDFTLLEGSNTTITQVGSDITIASDDTITRVKGGGAGSFVTGDVDITGSGDTTVSQSGNTITVSSTDTDTITRVRGTTSGVYTSGDISIVASGDATVSQSGSTITISSTNTDTNYAVSANGGLSLTPSNQFEIKNVSNLTDSTVVKWDNANKQLVSSIIEDDGSTVTIDGDLTVSGTTTTVDSTTIIVADNELELRKGSNIVGTDGGIRLNRTTNGAGTVQTFTSLQWYESGSYWRIYDGSVEKRIVTENDSQTLTNKTLTSPIFTNPTLGAATSTTINGLGITTTVGSTLTVASNKTVTFNNTLTLQGTDNATIAFNNGGTVAYTNINGLGDFQQTTSTSLRGIITDSTGAGGLCFSTSPTFTNSVVTGSSSFDVFNTTATTINAFGAASTLNIGLSGSTANLLGNLDVAEDATFGTVAGDVFVVNSTPNFVNSDVFVRGSSSNPFRIGRGNNEISTNSAAGYNVLAANTTGSENSGYGYSSQQNVTIGVRNTSVGYQSLPTSQDGSDNTAIGRGAFLNLTSGTKNVGLGNSVGDQLETGDANVLLGYFAGYNCQGTGNVLIGPSDTSAPSDGATYAPPNATGNRQLVIGSGSETWLRGDANFDVVMPNNVTVGFDIVVGGNMTVNGTTTTVNSSIVEVVDKTLELASVTNVNFNGTVTDTSATITDVTTTSGLIPGMELVINTAGITTTGGVTAKIVSIDAGNQTITLDVTLLGSSGDCSFTATGPNDSSADGAGIIIKGDTDKTILWEESTAQWEVSEHFQVPTGKEYRWNDNAVIKNLQLGPNTTGSNWTLGSDVVSSSLTSIGTLSSLTVSGNGTFSGTGYVKLPAGDTVNDRPASPADGMLRFNTDTKQFEGYATDTNDQNGAWGKIGGGATMSSSTPSGAAEGDLWYDTDDGRLYIYYNDGSGSPSAQWVDASPAGTPTNLTVEGTTTLRDNVTVGGDTTATNLEIKVTSTQATNTNKAFTINNNDQTEGLDISYKGEILPKADAGVNLGGPSNRWDNIYSDALVTSAIAPTGNLFATISGGNFFALQKTGGTENIAIFNSDGACEFYHNNSKRIDTTLDGVKITGTLEPEADATRDLGSATKRWANIYSADLQLSNEGAANEVDGTWGQYTIQEGEDDLFLINRRSGKKYKFNLTEVA